MLSRPEPLPVVKRAGDLEVKLAGVSTDRGVGGVRDLGLNGIWGEHYQPARVGGNIRTWFEFLLRSADSTNAFWVLHAAELSDATGNILTGIADNTGYRLSGIPQYANSADWSAYSESLPGSLWPDETAWRLKLQFKKLSGFDPRDLITFRNVPVPMSGATNSSFLTNSINGVQIVLAWPANLGDMKKLGLEPIASAGDYPFAALLGNPAGFALDFVQITLDGQPVTIADHGPRFSDTYLDMRSIPANAQTADITFVVQKTRTVEFLVKPPTAGTDEMSGAKSQGDSAAKPEPKERGCAQRASRSSHAGSSGSEGFDRLAARNCCGWASAVAKAMADKPPQPRSGGVSGKILAELRGFDVLQCEGAKEDRFFSLRLCAFAPVR